MTDLVNRTFTISASSVPAVKSFDEYISSIRDESHRKPCDPVTGEPLTHITLNASLSTPARSEQRFVPSKDGDISTRFICQVNSCSPRGGLGIHWPIRVYEMSHISNVLVALA